MLRGQGTFSSVSPLDVPFSARAHVGSELLKRSKFLGIATLARALSLRATVGAARGKALQTDQPLGIHPALLQDQYARIRPSGTPERRGRWRADNGA